MLINDLNLMRKNGEFNVAEEITDSLSSVEICIQGESSD